MSEDEEDELGVVMSRNINHLAALFYQSNGRIFAPDIDFQNSTHPEERGCWNKACIAFAFIEKDDWFLTHQV